MIAAVTRQLSTLHSRQAVIEAVCKTARSLTQADGACLILREGELVHYSEEDTIAPLWAGQRFPIGNCISGWSILNRTPAVIEDIFDDGRIPIAYYQSTFVRSLAIMPMTSDNPIGAIGVYWSRNHRATGRQLELLEALADIACIALVNVELFEKKERALQEAEEASRLKDEFLAALSHELRTPLNAIVGWTSMMRGGKLDSDTAAHALEVIERNARLQSQLVADLLDVSRVITGNLRLEVEQIELGPVIQRAVDSVQVAADAKEIRLQVTGGSLAAHVLGDAGRLQQVMWNLLSNAVKFTPPGGIVKVRLAATDSHVEIAVNDTGEGIDAEFLPFVFDRFRQSDGSITRRHGGLGLGLAIARHLVELHGGSIAASSDGRGLGSTFRVRLPVAAAQPVRASLPEWIAADEAQESLASFTDSLRGLKVLIVEDDDDSRRLFTLMLEQAGATARATESVAAALQAFEEFRADLILADIGMPGESGFDLLRKVRALPEEQRSLTPAVAVTSHAREEDRAGALTAGFAAHLSKPVALRELVQIIISLTAQGSR